MYDNYSFSDYGKPNFYIDEICENLGYQFQSKHLSLNTELSDRYFKEVEELEKKVLHNLEFIIVNSEFAKQQVLIFPVLSKVLDWVNFKLRIEYPINAGSNLKGKLDYLLISDRELVVIEAKNDNFEMGANQLVPELIAVSQKENLDIIYGAVTNGFLWQFHQLDAHQKILYQDTYRYSFPQNSKPLFGVLVNLLAQSELI